MSVTLENQQFSREGNLMPREIVAWLSGLRLPRTVRHPKRDFSNGFLVASICSRYWAALSMHTYEDNLSVANKQRNWEQLRKHFTAHDCPLSDRMIEGMIECRDGYADSFVRQLYTQLTGRALVEAAPLPTEKPVSVPVFVPPAPLRQHSKSTPTKSGAKQSAAEKPHGGTSAEMRVRELPNYALLNTATVQKRPHSREDKSPKTLAQRMSMRALGSETDADVTGDVRPRVAFAVSVHRATTGRTVVPKESLATEASVSRDCPTSVTLSATRDPNATVSDLIERIMRAETSRLAWPTETATGNGCGKAMPCTARFLREEALLEPSLQRRVWSALFASVAEIAESARRGGGSVAPVAALILSPPSSTGESSGTNKTTQNDYNDTRCTSRDSRPCSISEPTAVRGSASGRPAVSQRLVFLAALLAAIADADPFLAVPAFVNDVLPHAARAMRRRDYANVAGYVELFCAALPGERRLIAQILPDLLATTQGVITLPETAEARSSFYLLLRNVLMRLARRVWRGSASANQTMRRSIATPTPLVAATMTPSSSVDGSDAADGEALSRVIVSIGNYHILAALSHDSPLVRLAGHSLAEALAASGAPPLLLFGPALPLLLRAGRGGERTLPVLHCLRAAWLRAALRRYAQSPEFPACAAAAPLLEEFVRDICRLLRAPGSPRSRAFIAQQLALSLGDMVGSCFNAEEAAVAAIRTLDVVPYDFIVVFLGSVNKTALLSRQLDAPVRCALLGELRVDGTLRDCHPLPLSEAVLHVFPPNTEDHDDEDKGAPRARKKSKSRQVHQMAKNILRKRAVPTELARRVTWLHRICVSCRDANEPFPEMPFTTIEASTSQRWRQVMEAMYFELATVFMAAEMLFAENCDMADDIASGIGQMAGMAQHLVARWWEEMHRVPTALGSRGSVVDSTASTEAKQLSPVESHDRIAKAMKWYQENFGGSSEDNVNLEGGHSR